MTVPYVKKAMKESLFDIPNVVGNFTDMKFQVMGRDMTEYSRTFGHIFFNCKE